MSVTNDSAAMNEAHSLYEFVGRIWLRRFDVMMIGALFALFTLIYSVMDPKPYSIEATLRIDPGIPLVASASHIADVNIESEVSFIRSRSMLRAALDILSKTRAPLLAEALGNYSTAGIGPFQHSVPPAAARENMIYTLQKNLSVDSVGHRERSGLVQVSLITRDPAFGKAFVEVLINLYKKQAYDRDSASKVQALSKLEDTSKIEDVTLQQAETALTEFQQQHGIADLTLETTLNLQQMSTLQNQLDHLETKKEEDDVYYTDRHATTIATSRQIGYINKQMGQLQTWFVDRPELQRQLLKLMRNADTAKLNYTMTNEKIAQLRNEVASIMGFAQITDVPEVLKSARVAAVLKLMLISFMGGCAFGIIVVHILYYSPFTRIRTYDQLRQMSRLPILGIIHLTRKQRRRAHASPDQFSVSTNQASWGNEYDQLKRNLDAASFGDANNIMLFTCGPYQAETSGISSIIASLYAKKQKTILVDCNMARDSANPHHSGRVDPGLSEIITQATELDATVQKLNTPNLWYLPCGESTSYGQRLLENPGLLKTLIMLSQTYDRVILNYPAIVSRSDFGEVCTMAGSVIFIVKYGSSAEYTKHTLQPFEMIKNVKGLLVREI